MGFTPLCLVSVSATISGWYCVIMGERSPMLELIPRTFRVYRVRSLLLWNGVWVLPLLVSWFLFRRGAVSHPVPWVWVERYLYVYQYVAVRGLAGIRTLCLLVYEYPSKYSYVCGYSLRFLREYLGIRSSCCLSSGWCEYG